MTDINTQLLISIQNQLAGLQHGMGNIEARLDSGGEKHKEFAEQLDMIDRRTDIIENKTVKIEEILVPSDGSTKPLVTRIKNIEQYIGRQGLIIGGATTIFLGAFTLIGWAFSAFKEDILRLFRH